MQARATSLVTEGQQGRRHRPPPSSQRGSRDASTGHLPRHREQTGTQQTGREGRQSHRHSMGEDTEASGWPAWPECVGGGLSHHRTRAGVQPEPGSRPTPPSCREAQPGGGRRSLSGEGSVLRFHRLLSGRRPPKADNLGPARWWMAQRDIGLCRPRSPGAGQGRVVFLTHRWSWALERGRLTALVGDLRGQRGRCGGSSDDVGWGLGRILEAGPSWTSGLRLPW